MDASAARAGADGGSTRVACERVPKLELGNQWSTSGQMGASAARAACRPWLPSSGLGATVATPGLDTQAGAWEPVTVHRGLSRFSRRGRHCLWKVPYLRENGAVPLAPREASSGLGATVAMPGLDSQAGAWEPVEKNAVCGKPHTACAAYNAACKPPWSQLNSALTEIQRGFL
jgi:hypothetical protein